MRGAGIVIVTYNSAAEIDPCLEAALARCGPDDSIVVVDNASRDGTADRARKLGVKVKVLANPLNRGFAAAANQGVRAVSQNLILLLNPDAVLETGLDPMRQACERPEVAAVGGRLVDGRGQLQRGFAVRRLPTPAALALEALLVNRLWPRNPVNWHYRCLGLNLNLAARVEQPAGALFMFRRDVWERLGGFDESFEPLWFEDVDFCKRILDAGYQVYYVPNVVARHKGGHSAGQIPVESRGVYWYGNLLRYAAKHFRPGATRAVCFAILVGSFLRMVMGIVFRLSLKPIAEYSRVARLAGRVLSLGPAGVTRSVVD